MPGKIQLANSLNRLDCQGKLLVQCINPLSEQIKLPAGALIGKYHSIPEADVWMALETVADTQRILPRASRATVPEYVADLHRIVKGNLLAATALLRFAL